MFTIKGLSRTENGWSKETKSWNKVKRCWETELHRVKKQQQVERTGLDWIAECDHEVFSLLNFSSMVEGYGVREVNVMPTGQALRDAANGLVVKFVFLKS